MSDPKEMATEINFGEGTAIRYEDGNSGELTLLDIIHILWRGKYITIVCTFLALIIGVIYALISKEVFSTSTNFITKSERDNSGSFNQLAMLAGINTGSGGNVDPSNYLDKVIQDKDFLNTLFDRNWYYKGDSIRLEQILCIQPDTTISNWQHYYAMAKIEAIRQGKVMAISKDIKTGILTLKVNAPDPHLAYDLNLHTLDYISNYLRNSIKTQAKEKKKFIEERIIETKEELARNENALAKFRERNLISRAPQIALEEARLLRQVTLNQEIYIQFHKQYEMAKIQELDDQALIQIVKSADIPTVRSKPNRRMMVIISFFCGFAIGISITIVFGATPLLYARNIRIFGFRI